MIQQLSIDESIKRLKVEIIAQDWGLSSKRIELLEAAFSCLKQRFKNRKAAHAILIMAGSVLEYVKRKGESNPAESIDFLKEAMAHIVNLYESDEFDLEKDEKLFKGLYFRFNSLKQKIKAEKLSGATRSGAAEMKQVDMAKSEVPEDDFHEDALVPENIDQLRQRVFNFQESELSLDRTEVDRLVHDLQNSLERAEYVGETIRQLLVELLQVKEGIKKEKDEEYNPDDVSVNEDIVDELEIGEDLPEPQESFTDHVFAPPIIREESLIKNCPATEVRAIALSGAHAFIQENSIALMREVGPEKLQEYLKNSNIPLKDFGGFFKRLAKQFKGTLSTIPEKKLKKLTLPIMVPTGHFLADIPDEDGRHLVFVTNGQWNGCIVCTEVASTPVTMVKFKNAKNGDFVGMGYTEEGLELPLLNVVSILRREGFLTMV